MNSFKVLIIGVAVGLIIALVIHINEVNVERIENCVAACAKEGYRFKGYTPNIKTKEIDCECQEKYNIISIEDDNFG